MMNRRDLLQAGAATMFVVHPVLAAKDAVPQFKIIDTNVNLFQWPFRRLPLDETGALVKKLRSLAITQGWAGSFEAILHRDIASVNHRLVAACKNYPELIPIGSVNLQLPDWQADLHRCADVHKMSGIRLFPSYHEYTLADPRFEKLLKQAAKAGLFVQIAVTMEDLRTQHPRLRTPDVDLAPLSGVMRGIRGARVQILNLRPRATQLQLVAKTPGLHLDTARVEGTDGVPTLLKKTPASRVLFGTHAPLLIPEAALIRTHEAGQLDKKPLRALLSENARRLLDE